MDSLVATDNILLKKEVVTYLLNSLGFTFEFFITLVTTRAEPLTSHELFQLLSIHESCISHQLRASSFNPSTNLTISSTQD